LLAPTLYMEDDRIWILFARRVSREINPEELKELEALIREQPEHMYSMNIILRYMESSPGDDGGHRSSGGTGGDDQSGKGIEVGMNAALFPTGDYSSLASRLTLLSAS
jgi:hypothetical protein